jgi:hypothetical protein
MIIVNILQAHDSSNSFPEDRGGMAVHNVEACLDLYLKYV